MKNLFLVTLLLFSTFPILIAQQLATMEITKDGALDDTFNNNYRDAGYSITSNGAGYFSAFYSEYPDNNLGSGIFFTRTLGAGINVLEATIGNLSAFTSVNASAFNISSDRRLKKDITPITSNNSSSFMEQIRNIESATFWYNTENTDTRPVPHVGVIAQSLPSNLQSEFDMGLTHSTGEKRLGVSLADWLGLVTIGVKENDRVLQTLLQENETLRSEVVQLKTQVEEIKELKNMVSELQSQINK